MQMQSEDFVGHQPYVVEDSYHESAYEGNIAVNREDFQNLGYYAYQMPLYERHNALNQDVMMVPATPVDLLQEVNDLNFDLAQQLDTDIIPVPFNNEVDDEFELQMAVDVIIHDDEEPTLMAYVIVKVILLVMLGSAAIVTFQIKL